MTKLTELSTHFEFGNNWADFAQDVSAERIEQARIGLGRLITEEEIRGKDVLDIGCGSGLHALAALLMGARSVTAVDLDPKSVATTRAVLTAHAPVGSVWSVSVRSVFDLDALPVFPVVYSWGVLHHTGDMYRALANALGHVAPGGIFCFALYRKTPFCGFWQIEKRLFTRAPFWVRRIMEGVYKLSFRMGLVATGRDFRAYVDGYVRHRGMKWEIDVKDWLGGYPYESISETETLRWASDKGLISLRRFCRTPGWGLFGTGCDEYTFTRPTA